MNTNINSEIGKLEGVIIHPPGSEVENMTPENAERALYSDILNLSIASKEYAQLAGVLHKVSAVFEVKSLLSEILQNDKVKSNLLNEICLAEGVESCNNLIDTEPSQLASLLIEGVFL